MKRRISLAVTSAVLGLTAVAAPVRDTEEDGKYCIAIAGPTARMKPRISEHVRIAVRAGDEVSRRLGARSKNAGVEK